jgi:hypothetical protein
VTNTRPPPPGTVFGELRRDGSIATEFPWWGARPAGRRLVISGTRAGGYARSLRASVEPGSARAPRFWASTIEFPAAGCWRVRARAASATLTFVIQVERR